MKNNLNDEIIEKIACTVNFLEKRQMCFNELKRIKKTEATEFENEVLDIYKKIFIINLGFNIEFIDLAKAFASNNTTVQKYACYGVMFEQYQDKGVLLNSIIEKNIKKGYIFVKYINLIGNFSKNNNCFGELLDKILKIDNETINYNKLKYNSKLTIANFKHNNLKEIPLNNSKLDFFIWSQLFLKYDFTVGEKEVYFYYPRFILKRSFFIDNVFKCC
ncbi:hypothetical protein EHP00_354 [Ecytonucleospora hepatopenaei]|uniref:Uncharacterized protein n=1 Tax=Ecytonucleospora hepatopenaei TaxID=646526 RepID=A0A1W0E720_9MICR|nr:hypothetical protein EHP00_354 [Ecytonucleospora hepatopenaei]